MFGSSSAISTLRPDSAMPSPWSERLLGGRRRGQRERKTRAFARPAFHPHPAAEMLDDLPADVQAQPRARRLLGQHIARLAELVEDHRLVLGLDPRAVVAHVDADDALRLAQGDLDAAPALGAELERVR